MMGILHLLSLRRLPIPLTGLKGVVLCFTTYPNVLLRFMRYLAAAAAIIYSHQGEASTVGTDGIKET